MRFGEKTNEVIEQLLQFTLNGERIRIGYTSGLAGQKRTNTFDLEPLSLVSCRGALYLLARRLTNENRAIDPPATDYAEDVRTFSIQRIDARRGGRGVLRLSSPRAVRPVDVLRRSLWDLPTPGSRQQGRADLQGLPLAQGQPLGAHLSPYAALRGSRRRGAQDEDDGELERSRSR